LIRLLDYLVGVLNFEEPPFNLKNILVPGLLRIALLLLLAPLHGALLTDATKAAANQFVLQLHQHFNRDQQDELIRSILELFDASDTATSDFSFLTSKSAIEDSTVRSRTQALTDVKRSVLAALTGLAKASPASLIRFKHALLRRVASETAATSPEATRELCKLLTMLVRESDSESDAIEASELYTLTHKLLFSGTFTRDSGRAARGVILATELLLCNRCCDKESIQAWVLRLLLPSTRRMMDPELGPPGLRFLEALQSQKKPPGRDGVFVHFKMILANTGLIQMLESFQATKREDASLLVYSDVPQMLKITMARNTRKMIFCVSFFLSHTVNMVNNPARWPFATHWVFELVDTYLQMGRQKSTVWRPEGWLVAPIQFPNPFPTNGAVRNLPKEVVDWIKCCCCRFHVMADSESTCCVPKERIRVMLACMDVQERLRLQESLSRFSLAMLIGISLSAAVLKNAFGHWKMQQSQRSESTSVLFRLIKFQLLKIYDLCEKSEHLDIAHTSTVTKQTRISRKKKAASSAAEDMSGNGVHAAEETTGKANDNEVHMQVFLNRAGHQLSHAPMVYSQNSSLLAKTSTSPSQARSLRLAMFTSHDTFDINVLCDVVFDRNDSETIRLCLDELSATSAQATRETIASCFCLIEFRTHLLRHICSLLGARPQAWVEGGSALCKDRVSHCLKAASFLLEAIPKLRRGYFAQVSRKVRRSRPCGPRLLTLVSDTICPYPGTPSRERSLEYGCSAPYMVSSIAGFGPAVHYFSARFSQQLHRMV
jgi:hypothetical protein